MATPLYFVTQAPNYKCITYSKRQCDIAMNNLPGGKKPNCPWFQQEAVDFTLIKIYIYLCIFII